RQSLATVPPIAAVRFLGRGSQADLTTRILPAHDLLLVTSPRETGPLVAWEAMAAGVVVVSSRYLGSGLEGALVDQRNSRLFEVGDSGAAARCIAELAEPGARAELALAARRMIESRYRRELSVAAWQAAFAAALATPPREMATVIPRRGQTAGRLDRWFGIGFAENLREWLGREFVHSSPGGEWPHSYGNWGDETEFLALARRLDRDEAAA
ncbi:MAG: glycosyltransferase family 4 protein, partial [Acidobacteriota bacterium]|nr:glycosyltransferase family 4 protein [Acidobacteriota bacterium]